MRQELLTFLGADDESFSLRASGPSVVLRPVVSRDSEPPSVQTAPFAAPRAGLLVCSESNMSGWTARITEISRASSGNSLTNFAFPALARRCLTLRRATNAEPITLTAAHERASGISFVACSST